MIVGLSVADTVLLEILDAVRDAMARTVRAPVRLEVGCGVWEMVSDHCTPLDVRGLAFPGVAASLRGLEVRLRLDLNPHEWALVRSAASPRA